MAESAETPKLSGLARSIDALFASPPPAARPSPAPSLTTGAMGSVEVEPAPMEVVPADAVITPPPLRDVVPAPPAMPEMFPASQMLAALPADPWIRAETPSSPVEPMPSAADASQASIDAEPILEIARVPAEEAGADSSWAAPVPDEPTAVEPARDDSDPDALVRAVEAFVAGEPGARERVESLASALRERLALDPLADAVETLVREAGDPPDQRFLDLAGSVVNPAVASRLVQRMGQDPERIKRDEYFALCRRMGRVMANGLKGALTGALDRDVRRVYHDALISMGEASRPVIEGMVQDDNRFLVRDGVTILGEIGGARAVELVTSALADTDARVRSEALLALGKLGEDEAGQLVLGCLDDPDSTVRIAAAVASGQLGLERALRPLLHMLEGEEDPEKCIPVLRALGQIGDPGAVHAIEKHAVPSMFSRPRTDVRIAAYRALHEIGTPHARDLIKQTAQDKDPVVRVALKDLTRAD